MRTDPVESERSFLRETLLPILAVVAVVVPLRSAVADWNDVPSGSMRPTILEGDRISMDSNRLTINGEVLVYDDLPLAAEDPHPADRRRMADLRTEWLDNRSHAIALTPGLAGRIDSFHEFLVPEGHYFFLGDNRDRSRDSRFVGTVPRDEIYGRVTHVALSVDPKRNYRPRFDRWFQPLDPDLAPDGNRHRRSSRE